MLPVILGSDWNVYGVAFSFYQKYHIHSFALGIRHQRYTDHLDFLTVETDAQFMDPRRFLEILLQFAERHRGEDLLLIPCSDYYMRRIVENQEQLRKFYRFNVIDLSLYQQMESKIDFYRLCEKHKIPHPQTVVVDPSNYREIALPFGFPIIAKPNDSFSWVRFPHFEGYKKAFRLETREELDQLMEKIYGKGYQDAFLLQDFIPGGTDAMFVVNAYVDQKGILRMTHAAQTALDEVLPNDVGNYNALISGDYPELVSMIRDFFEKIPYRGYANFDIKRDVRDGVYKLFEINMRQGRSSMYMTYAGNNFVQYLVDDLVENKPRPYYNHIEEHLWYLVDKSVLLKYTPEALQTKVRTLLREKKADYGFSYYSHKNLFRFLLSWRRRISTIRYYPRLAGKS